MRFRLLRCGTDAVLVECADLGSVLVADSRLRVAMDAAAEPCWAAVRDLVPAARTLLLQVERGTDLDGLRTAISRQLREPAVDPPADPQTPAADPVEVEVHYDGPDLDAVAAHTGLTTEEVIAAHTGHPWRVAFSGFAPGFAYLVGGDRRLEVPRLATPRTSVPAGSVGLAGAFSGVYPRASPGGWQLIGRTDAVLFDPDRDPPALLRPGLQVQFRAIGRSRRHRTRSRSMAGAGHRRPIGAGSGRSLAVERIGLPVLVQDAGRPGYARLGVSASGAADRASYDLGARLLGHRAGEAALEITHGGLAVRAHGSCTIVLTGADADARLDGRAAPHAAPFWMADGQLLELGVPTEGLRTYLSVRGGIEAPAVLGSRSTDTLSGLGPPPVRAGDHLVVGTPAPGWWPQVDMAVATGRAGDALVLEAILGPRDDWFDDPAQLARPWTISADSDRVGVRLSGTALQRTRAAANAELPSEAMVTGSVQVPPSGQPVVFLADHPVTGGYPVIAVLAPHSVDLLAQTRPGQAVRIVRGR